MIHGILNPITTSIIAVIMRLVGSVLLVVVMQEQSDQFARRSNVQPLKRLMFYLALALALSNIIPFFANASRINDGHSTEFLVSAATLSNAASLLIAAVMLHLIYRFRAK